MLEINEWVDAKDLPDGVEKEVYFDPQTRGFYTVRISTDHARQCYWRRPCRKIGRLVGELEYSRSYLKNRYYYATVELAGGRMERADLWNLRKGNLWHQPFVLDAVANDDYSKEFNSADMEATLDWRVYGTGWTDFGNCYDGPIPGEHGHPVYTNNGIMRMLGPKRAVAYRREGQTEFEYAITPYIRGRAKGKRFYIKADSLDEAIWIAKGQVSRMQIGGLTPNLFEIFEICRA